MQDVFRPRHEPTREIYDAFQTEAAKRNGREPEEWQRLEVMAVLDAANMQAALYPRKYKQITVVDVLDAEISARGHIDYGAKWAYAIVDKMQR